MKQPKNKLSYEQQKQIWYKKLKDEGFVDIEHGDGSINSGVPRTIRTGQNQADTIDAVRSYYAMAAHFLNEYKFENKLDQTIWMYFAEGLTYREIAHTINKTKRKADRISKDLVWRRITKFEKIMKQRYLSI